MRHDWILQVLTDLKSYAQKNDLPEIAIKADALLEVAQSEIAKAYRGEDDSSEGAQRH